MSRVIGCETGLGYTATVSGCGTKQPTRSRMDPSTHTQVRSTWHIMLCPTERCRTQHDVAKLPAQRGHHARWCRVYTSRPKHIGAIASPKAARPAHVSPSSPRWRGAPGAAAKQAHAHQEPLATQQPKGQGTAASIISQTVFGLQERRQSRLSHISCRQ